MSTVTKPAALAAQLETVRRALTPLLEELGAIVEGRDRLIAKRLGEQDYPVEIGDDRVARTTYAGYQDVVLPTFEEIEGTAAFTEWVRILDLLDRFGSHGLSWGVIGDEMSGAPIVWENSEAGRTLRFEADES